MLRKHATDTPDARTVALRPAHRKTRGTPRWLSQEGAAWHTPLKLAHQNTDGPGRLETAGDATRTRTRTRRGPQPEDQHVN